MRYINKLALILFVVFFLSCKEDNEPLVTSEPVYYEEGTIVVNEGNFGQSNGSLTLITGTFDSLVVIQDIVGKANNGIVTGDVVQSVIQYENRLFVVANNDSKILVLNSGTFEQEAVIESGLSLPRYMAIANDRLFVTNWNNDFTNSFVSVFKFSDLKLNWTIQTDPGTEKILIDSEENVWVTNNLTNTVQYFRSTSRLVEKTINVGASPNGILNSGDYIYVLCQGTFGGSDGSLYKIDKQTQNVLDSVSLNFNPGGHFTNHFGLGMLNSGSILYLFDPSKEIDQSLLIHSDASSEVTSLYGFGLASTFFVLDSKNFETAGELILYRSKQDFLRVPVGIGPNSIVIFEN